MDDETNRLDSNNEESFVGITALKQLIQSVFPTDSMPATKDLIEDPRLGEEIFLHTFGGHEWDDVPAERVAWDYDVLPLLTPSAYRYYLPAYLMAALDYRPGDMLLPSLLFFLTPPLEKNVRYQHFLGQVHGLSHEQRFVIRSFIEFVIAFFNVPDDADQIAKLRVYWG